MTNKYSKNRKLNNVLTDIEEQLLMIHETREESLSEIKHYMENFPTEADYNLYKYGNLLIMNNDIRQMYLDAGYTSMMKMSDNKICEIYQRQVGYVARRLSEM